MISIVRSLRPWLATGALIVLSGCGLGGTPHQTDPAHAEKVLLAALDAWKSGQRPQEMENRQPPVRVRDLDWADGFRLVGYRAEEQGRLVGYDANYSVVLELKDPKGNPVKKTAVYTVTTHPEILILRQEG